MCILCVIQKWSRRVATMLPWLVIPLIGLWLLSQLLPPAFRFEITSPRLACVFVLLVTLFWYEILMPWLSAWRLRRNARLRERKRFEAIELQKLRKTATRRCRNCLTPYRDQNPGGGKFMCSYCGHVSKRPVLDLPVPPGLGLSNSGILKDLVGKGGKILNGKAWSDNGWLCGQDWLENGNWAGGSFVGKPSNWRNGGGGGGIFGGEDDCLTEKSYSRVLIFACKLLSTVFLSLLWLWRKIFRISSSRDDASVDPEGGGGLDKGNENGGTNHESRGEKARRKAEEKRQARIERELLEEEERKQREEVARLVEEQRRLRDELMGVDKDHGKRSPPSKGKTGKKEAEKKRQERRKDRDRGSSKSNSDVEELEKRAGKDSERYKKCDSDRRESQRTISGSPRAHGSDAGHAFKANTTHNHSRGIAGNRYFDRVRGTFLSSSRAFTGGSFFGKTSNSTVPREPKSNAFVDQYTNKRELSQVDRVSVKPSVNGDEKNNARPILLEPQHVPAPKKSWQQLFTRSSSASPPSNSNVISRPNGGSKLEANNPFPCSSPPTQAFDNHISFALQSALTPTSFPFGSTNSTSFPSTSEAMFTEVREAPLKFLPEESEIYEDPCYDPDPVSLLGPVSESLDNFPLDLGFVSDTGLETPTSISRPSPIESPLSRLRVSEEKHGSPFSFSGTSKPQDLQHLSADGQSNANDAGTWQMWNSFPLVQEGLGLVGGPSSWHLPTELNRHKNEDMLHHTPQKTMASLFKNDDQVLTGTQSAQKVSFGCVGGPQNHSMTVGNDGSWLPPTYFRPNSGSDGHFSPRAYEEASQNNRMYGSPGDSVPNHVSEVLTANTWVKNDKSNMQGSGVSVGNASVMKPHVGGLYSSPDVQSLWSYD